LCERIAAGASTESDSPESQWALYNNLRPYLLKNATLLDTSELPMHHTLNERFRTRSGGIVHLNQSLGFVEISSDKLGAEYLERLFRDQGISVDTTKIAISG
jgi:hypothetical protein